MKKSFLPLCLITVLLGASLTGCGSSAKPAAEPSTASTVSPASTIAETGPEETLPPAYEAAYEAVKQDYIGGWNTSSDSWLSDFQGTSARFSRMKGSDITMYHSEEALFYALQDLDGNGTPELLIGIGAPNFAPFIYDAFGFNGSDAVRLTDAYEFLILKDGTFVTSDYFGYVERILQLRPDGFTLDDISDPDIHPGYSAATLDLSVHGGKLEDPFWEPMQ